MRLKKSLIFLSFNVCFSFIFSQLDTNALMKDSLIITKIKLNSPVNTEYNEFGPVLSTDLLTMFFTSDKPSNSSSKRIEQIYMCKRQNLNSEWSEPKKILFNNPTTRLFTSIITKLEATNISIVNTTPDAQKILIYIGSHISGDIYVSYLKGDTFTSPRPLPSPINSNYQESSAVFSADGKKIFFVSDRPGGKGGKDIWVSNRINDSTWSEPENLGDVINTPKDEEFPFIHPDGKTLYFSSKGHNSKGGYDIFYSELKDNKWQKPVALTQLNSTNDDLFFFLGADMKTAFYSSFENKKNSDIFEVRFQYKKFFKSPNILLLKGKIINELTNQFTSAIIKIINTLSKDTAVINSNSSTGEYLAVLNSGNNYKILVQDTTNKSLLPFEDELSVPDTVKYAVLVKDIYLSNILYIDISGYLLDKNKTPQNNITVLLKSKKDGKIIQKTTTDNKGFFVFRKVPASDEYIIEADYHFKYSVNGKINKHNSSIPFKDITINNSSPNDKGEFNFTKEESALDVLPVYLKSFSEKDVSLSIFNNPEKFKQFVEKYGDKEIEGVSYRIQIGAYKNPEKFEKSILPSVSMNNPVIKNASPLDTLKKFHINKSFKTINQAIEFRDHIKKYIPDAFISVFYNDLHVILTEDILRTDL